MKEIKWDLIPNNVFKRKEFDDPNFPGSGDNINKTLLNMMIALRLSTGIKIRTHWEVGGAVDIDGSHDHEEDSFHLLKNDCKALDWHFITNISTREQCHIILQAGFTGMGFYYDQHYSNKKLPIAFHTDIRSKKRTQIWTRVDNQSLNYLLK